MCDTFYIPKNLNLYHANILCKNSDREPNEAQSIIHIHHTQHTSDKVKLTYIEIPQVKNTYEVYLSKPFQMWGAEMGVNECGVAIGNEAVFTKFSFAKKNNGLTGMDMIRLALERKNSAKSALEYIIELIETYGQDACGGYENKNFFYHNSFLIVDKKEAYCLETADKFWAYKKLNHFYAISNGLTILDDYDEIHPQAIEYAKQKNGIMKKVLSILEKPFRINSIPIWENAMLEDKFQKKLPKKKKFMLEIVFKPYNPMVTTRKSLIRWNPFAYILVDYKLPAKPLVQ